MLNVVIMFGRRYTPLRGFLTSVVMLHHYGRLAAVCTGRNLFLSCAGNNTLPGKNLLPQLRSRNISFGQVKVNT